MSGTGVRYELQLLIDNPLVCKPLKAVYMKLHGFIEIVVMWLKGNALLPYSEHLDTCRS